MNSNTRKNDPLHVGNLALQRFIRRAVLEVGVYYPDAIRRINLDLLRLGIHVTSRDLVGVPALAGEMINKAKSGGGISGKHEYRLNDAGFKLYLTISTRGKVTARVGGDQAKCYPEATELLRKILKEEGLEDDK